MPVTSVLPWTWTSQARAWPLAPCEPEKLTSVTPMRSVPWMRKFRPPASGEVVAPSMKNWPFGTTGV